MSIRNKCPDNNNKFYLKTTGGGYNKCILGNANNKYNARPTKSSVLPNCVGYVYGRYLEYHGLTKANLPTCNAKDWYSVAKENGFKCSRNPTVGSIVCFKGTVYGHVAFVERIESNGDLYLSESNWGHRIFRNVTVSKKSGYNYSTSLKLVGFIANPNAKEPEKPKESTPVKDVPKYTKGNYQVSTADVLLVRTGAGTENRAKDFSELTKDARQKIKKLNNNKAAKGYVKGLKFSVTEVKNNWGKTPSGWVCLDYCKKV